MISNLIDILRILIVSVGFYWGYQLGYENGYNPEEQLHIMIPLMIVAIAGISGFEGLFFGKNAAKAKGYEQGSNYQKQSSIALLSYAVVAVIIYILNWGIKAELTLVFAFFFFFIFSGINHAANAIKEKNYKWQNINRPFITLILIAGIIYPIIMAIKNL